MRYKFAKIAPKPIKEEIYCKSVLQDYQELLKCNGDNEFVFQEFFEKNPCMVPGARQEYSTVMGSGNGPLHEALISKPQIKGIKKRYPDFMWLAYDSLNFSPVLVEIEAPDKKNFKKDETPNAKFNQAKHQIIQWQTILSKPENQHSLFEDYNIPEYLRENKFKPHFILIYGRRSEYENNKWLRQQRAELEGTNLTIMSFDRLTPQIERRNYISCVVKNKKYYAKYLSPTFYFGPYEEQLINFEDLVEAVDNMSYTTIARKKFLKKRIPYCLKFIKEKRLALLIPAPYYRKSKE